MRVVLSILEDTDGVKLKKRGMDIEGESDDGAEQEMVTFQTALGRTVQSTVSAHDLTWEMAARVLGRPFRYRYWKKWSRSSIIYIDVSFGSLRYRANVCVG